MNIELLNSTLNKKNRLIDYPSYEEGNMDDFYAEIGLRPNWLLVLGNYLEPLVKPEMKGLDLGSAFGDICFTLALLGIKAYGIDARLDLVSRTNKAAQQLQEDGVIDFGSCQFYPGNYFPLDFPVDPLVKWGRLTNIPNNLEQLNPYNHMGLTLADFDIVTMYQYNRNKLPTLQLINERCSPNTLIVFASDGRPYNYKKIAPNLNHTNHIKTDDNSLKGIVFDFFEVR